VQNFIVEPLAKDQIAAAFPLIREALPKLDIRSWTRLARDLTNPRRANRRGILAARRDQRRHASGLLYYRKERDLEDHAVLIADHFVALDLLDARPVAAALVTALERLARELGCSAIRSVVHASSPEVADELFSAGHSLEGATLYKTLTPNSAPAQGGSLFPILVTEDCREGHPGQERPTG
jgi:hypothetical protein